MGSLHLLCLWLEQPPKFTWLAFSHSHVMSYQRQFVNSAMQNQAGLELTKACLCFESTGIKGVNLHTWFYVLIFGYIYICIYQVEKSCMKARIYTISECPEHDRCPTYICWMNEWIIQTTTHSVLFFFYSSVQAKNFQWVKESNH